MRLVLLVLLVALAASACSTVERKPIRLAPTPTAEAGVRVIVDNCPGPSIVTLSVRDDVIWQAEAPLETEDAADESADAAVDEASTDGLTEVDTAATSAEAPGLIEIVIGRAPDGWTETVPLEATLRGDTRYTVSTEPDEQSVDFAVPDLAQGLLFDGIGRSQFNQDLMMEPCSQPADVGSFVNNLAILMLLGVTTAAFVLVALISLLFVVTRRFGRIRALERKARRARAQSQAQANDQRPRTRSTN